MLAGKVKEATTDTLKEANKILRFAKHNADVHLQFRCLGGPQELTFIVYSDAAFATRQDYSSQGGYLLLLVHRDGTHGSEGNYNLVDWRSWKLPRVARSSLSAESQAASEASDVLLHACTFWNLVWLPHSNLEALSTARLQHPPSLVIDAKALYDLLTRLEAYSSGCSDKRTVIEVLVSQDKLKCARADVKWVSSELQYADGLTKDAAALLLAQRLRSHKTRIKLDLQFQAAKKKDAQSRKENAELYAIKRPVRALQSAVVAGLMTGAQAQADYDGDTFGIRDYEILICGTLVIMALVHYIILQVNLYLHPRETTKVTITDTSTPQVVTSPASDEPPALDLDQDMIRMLEHEITLEPLRQADGTEEYRLALQLRLCQQRETTLRRLLLVRRSWSTKRPSFTYAINYIWSETLSLTKWPWLLPPSSARGTSM